MTFVLTLIAFATIFALHRRVASLEQQLREIESSLVRAAAPHEHASARTIAPDETAPPTAAFDAPRPAARTIHASAPPAPADTPADTPSPAPARETPAPSVPRLSLEDLIGGRLPIWIGGAALVLAGFFLVRYSIESGLLGPAARTLLAALFAFALIGASEVARRLPATADDPRVAQSLAGAGVASLYATLYLAAALYDLVTPLPAFFLVLAVTILALALSLRHGPPTAVMALVGGFAAPLVAGFDAVGIAPLLVYLGLLVAALFGLAVHRGWGWLAIAAVAAGFGWVNFLLAALSGLPGDLTAIGVFILLLAVGSSAAMPAAGIANRWLRIAPLVAGLVQLLVLAPALDFGGLPWSFYLVLAAATLFLAWRDVRYLPGALAALVLLLVLEAIALLQPERSVTPVAALLATLLFAVPGHLLARRNSIWQAIALGGTAGPLLVAQLSAWPLLSQTQWGLITLIGAAAAAHLAWRSRADQDPRPLVGATAVAGLLAALGLAHLVPYAWIAVPLTAVMLALAAWARINRAPALHFLPAYPFFAAIIASPVTLSVLLLAIVGSVSGDRLPYLQLPALADLTRTLALPVAAALFLLRTPAHFHPVRRFVTASAITLAILILYVLAKQPLALAQLDRFATWGFVERAILTQICLAAGWALMRAHRFPPVATALLALGLSRIVWFDLVVLNPVFEPQLVGSIPLLNAAVLHAALAAFWFWTLPPARHTRPVAALLTLVAVLALVRQLAHGSLLTGGIGNGENGGYSAALLACALFWLWRGITAAKHDLRVAGLALLTLVTFKVFLVDAAALDGVLRILSFLGLGLALIGIGWAYGRFLGKNAAINAGKTAI